MKFIKCVMFLVLMYYSAFATTFCVIAEHTTPQGGEVFITHSPSWDLHSLGMYAAYCSYDIEGNLWLVNKWGVVWVYNGRSFVMTGSVPGTVHDISAHDRIIVATSTGMFEYTDTWERINYIDVAFSIESCCDEDSELYCLINDLFVLSLNLSYGGGGGTAYYYPQLPGASHDISYSQNMNCPQVICNSGAERELFYYTDYQWGWKGDGYIGDLKRVDTFVGVTGKIKESGPVTTVMYDMGVVVITQKKFVDIAVYDFGPVY